MASRNINRFNRGELSPRLKARSEAEYHRYGCQRFENFFPMSHGPASRRPGFRFIAEAMEQNFQGTF